MLTTATGDKVEPSKITGWYARHRTKSVLFVQIDEKGLDTETVDKIGSFVKLREGSPFLTSDSSKQALNDLDKLFQALDSARCVHKVVFDLSLARGTNPGAYAKELMRTYEDIVSDTINVSVTNVVEILCKDVKETSMSGSSNVLIANFNGQLHLIPSQINSCGAHGSPCQCFVTLFRILITKRRLRIFNRSNENLSESNVKKAILSARKQERVKIPSYNIIGKEGENIYPIKEFLSHPSGIEALLNKHALQISTYRCTLPPLNLLNFEVSLVIVLRVTLQMKTAWWRCYLASCTLKGNEKNDKCISNFKLAKLQEVELQLQQMLHLKTSNKDGIFRVACFQVVKMGSFISDSVELHVSSVDSPLIFNQEVGAETSTLNVAEENIERVNAGKTTVETHSTFSEKLSRTGIDEKTSQSIVTMEFNYK
ncbi:hypothetical protein Tco_0195230 [Tanacetum coccineum]